MNVEIGTEAAQFPEKEYISGIFLAVWEICIKSVNIENLGLTLATARVRIVSSSPPFARSEPLKLTLSRKNAFMIIIGFLFSSVVQGWLKYVTGLRAKKKAQETWGLFL